MIIWLKNHSKVRYRTCQLRFEAPAARARELRVEHVLVREERADGPGREHGGDLAGQRRRDDPRENGRDLACTERFGRNTIIRR